MLWVMDASINISMEPFRAFVGDNLPKAQRTRGFAMQSFFIGIGAIVASALPWMMTNWFDVSNTAGPGQIPDSVKWSFYLGGFVFFLAVLWTVISSREYSPEEIEEFEAGEQEAVGTEREPRPVAKYYREGVAWIVTGMAFLSWIVASGLDKQLYILAIGVMVFGMVQIVTGWLQSKQQTDNGWFRIVDDLFHMPRVMKQLAVVQFFSWFALFAMWIYSTAAVTSYHFGTSDATSQAYNDGANWVGVLFASYNGFAALAAVAIPFLARKLGCRWSHLVNLSLGGVGLISFLFIRDPAWLTRWAFTWASLISSSSYHS
jgi:maltose/moltooligosaccharide transporter